ncbi:MAG: hypothetical protein Fur0034_21680 [Desulfuromonadia bacterium]
MQDSSFKLSVITPVKNACNDIVKCIESVASQSFASKEHIIIDGLSSDNTLDLVERLAKKYNHLKYISEADHGIYDAMNKGIDIASGEWIYFLGSDDQIYDDHVVERVMGISDIDSLDFLYGNVVWGDTGIIYDGKFSLLKLMKKNICHQAIFYRKNIFQQFGKFDVRYSLLADYLMNIILFSSGIVRIKYIDIIVAKYGIYGKSTLMVDLKFFEDYSFIINKYFPKEYIEIMEENELKISEIKTKDNIINELNMKINRLAAIENSLSWRLTKPLRLLGKILQSFRENFPMQRS